MKLLHSYCTHLIRKRFKNYSVDSSTLNESIYLYAPSILLYSFYSFHSSIDSSLIGYQLLILKKFVFMASSFLPYTFAVYEESVLCLPSFFSQSRTQSRSNDFLTVYHISLISSFFLTFSVVFSNFLLFSLISSCIFRLCSQC